MRCILLLWLAVITTGLGAQPASGKQVEQKLTLPDGRSIPYLLYLPADYQANGTAVPLMLFLHGRGESHGPLSLVKKWGPPHMIDSGHSFPFIVASPQCPGEDSWSRPTQQTLLVALLEHLAKTYRVNTSRVYLTGLSMGGYGSWRLAADHPQRFAAIVPICGAGKPADAPRLVKLPIWVWHGTEDGAVPFRRSEEMVEAIRAAGGEKILFTTLEHIGHNSWEAAYATPQLYEWLLKHTAPSAP